MSYPPLNPILVVEDNAEDFAALSRAFRKHALQHPVLRCADGDQALAYLRSHSQAMDGGPMLPVLVLLDLNLPDTDGRAVLEAFKQDPQLRAVPVIVFSTSSSPRDIASCYQLGANSYLTKPLAYAVLEEKIRLMLHYWLHVSEIPPATDRTDA